MRLTRGENGTRTVALVDLGDAVATSKDPSELPTVEDAIDVAREDAETNVPLAVPTPKESGASERARHELTRMPFRNWCCSCVAGRGADDAHRKSDGYTGPPRVECDFMFLSSRVHLVNGGSSHREGCGRDVGAMLLGHVGRVETIKRQSSAAI